MLRSAECVNESVRTMTLSRRKERGAFYTPPHLAKFLVNWAIRSKDDLILDPGFGRGVFLKEAFRRLIELGATSEKAINQLYGVEIDPESFIKTSKSLENLCGAKVPHLYNKDFFDIPPPDSIGFPKALIQKVHAVIGNPPYIRYQSFKGKMRKKALSIARQVGVKLTDLASSWAPYLIHATRFLRDDGRLAMVVPAELIQTNYAAPIRKWLLNAFRNVILITFEKRVFPGVLEDTMLLMANKSGSKKGLAILKLESDKNLEGVHRKLDQLPVIELVRREDKWTKLLLKPEEYGVYAKLAKMDGIIRLSTKASIDIGVVTGANNYFLLTKEEVARWDIEDHFLVPAIRKATNIPGIIFTINEWKGLHEKGEKCLLLLVSCPPREIKRYKLWKYLEYANELGIKERYKIRIRDPWYKVPYVKVPDAFLTYMSASMPRIVLNEARAVNTNTVHSVFIKDKANKKAVISSFYNTLTMLSAELTGRSYGGGVLKLEPKEAERVLIIDVKEESVLKELNGKFLTLDRLIRGKRYEEALGIVDDILLYGYLGLSSKEIGSLHSAYHSIKSRRLARMG